MNKKNFQQVFESYFHKKYTFNDFLNTLPQESINFKTNRFESYSFISYLKDSNRELTSEAKKLKDFHSFLNVLLFKEMKTHNKVFSYRENKNIFDAVYLHKDSKNYFKTDIKSFFTSIDKKLIMRTLKDNLEEFDVFIDKKYVEHIINLIIINNQLPIGFITSPTISNAVLYNFDKYFEKYSIDKKMIYSRYSDDLIFSSNDYKVLIELENKLTNYFDSYYDGLFKLNSKKTKFLDKTRKIVILGLVITPNGHITVDKERRNNIQKLIYFYKTDKHKFSKLLELKYDNQLSKAYGSLNYINYIDKNFIIKLRSKYGNYIIDKFLHGVKPR
ncbi:MAG: reverse transcriptase domain-containing protein [Poseidonibacter sp.]|uniref:reverse transcriptase domain-containing protein n=1 Tax=Poseidonibacter sp. TaxID=2321188 RepID=UPI00359EAB3C